VNRAKSQGKCDKDSDYLWKKTFFLPWCLGHSRLICPMAQHLWQRLPQVECGPMGMDGGFVIGVGAFFLQRDWVLRSASAYEICM